MLAASDPGALFLVMPSDHVIADAAAFHAAVEVAASAARAGALVTFGIAADRPETGYGYIRRGAALRGQEGCYAVAAFIEKPDRARAEAYVAAGDYAWNSGIFLFPAGLYVDELARQHPELVAGCRAALDKAQRDLTFLRLDKPSFAALRGESIDYAVMEHTKRAAVVPVAMGWNDIGSWDALWSIGDKDGAGNVMLGDVIAEDSKNSYFRSEERLIAALGVEDLIVVATGDVVLVARRDRAQDIKSLVARLERAGRSELGTHLTVHRPWGTYRSIHEGERVQVKHIMVKPGAQLSLQMHHHRAEHWVVVSGTAKVVRGEDEIMLYEDQSTYIFRSAPSTGWRTPARSPSTSSRCSPAPISARTTSSASRTLTGGADRRTGARRWSSSSSPASMPARGRKKRSRRRCASRSRQRGPSRAVWRLPPIVPPAIRGCSGSTRAGSTRRRSRPMPYCRTPNASWNAHNS